MTRILANMGSAGEVRLLENIRAPLARTYSDEACWLTGLYLDKPVYFDDPYRYYRW